MKIPDEIKVDIARFQIKNQPENWKRLGKVLECIVTQIEGDPGSVSAPNQIQDVQVDTIMVKRTWVDDLVKKNVELNQENKRLIKEYFSIQEQSSAYVKRVDEFTSRNSMLKSEVKRLENNYDVQNKMNKGLKEDVRSLNTENDKLVEELSKTQAKLQQVKKRFSNFLTGYKVFLYESKTVLDGLIIEEQDENSN